MPSASQKKIPKQFLFGLVAIMVLVIGIAIAAVVSNRQQDNRQQAAGLDCLNARTLAADCPPGCTASKPGTEATGDVGTVFCSEGTPVDACGTGRICGNFIGVARCIGNNPAAPNEYCCPVGTTQADVADGDCDKDGTGGNTAPNCSVPQDQLTCTGGIYRPYCMWTVDANGKTACKDLIKGSGGGTVTITCTYSTARDCANDINCQWIGSACLPKTQISTYPVCSGQCASSGSCKAGTTWTSDSATCNLTVPGRCCPNAGSGGGGSGGGGVPTGECSDYCAGIEKGGQCEQQGGHKVDRPCSFAACAPGTGPCKIPSGGGSGGGGSSGGGSAGGGTTSTSNVIGETQFLDCSMVYGYACDSLDWSRKLRVAIYVDSFVQEKIIDDTAPLANLFRDSYVGSKCGNDIAHGFKLDLTTARAQTLLKDGKSHTLLVRAVGLTKNDSNGSLESNPSKGPFQPVAASNGVNLTITCNTAVATATPTATPTGTPATPPTPTATPIAAVTPTPAATPQATPITSPNPQCGATCATNNDCPINHVCSNNRCILNECQTKSCDNNKCYRIEYVTNTVTNTITNTVYVEPTPTIATTTNTTYPNNSNATTTTKGGEPVPVSGTTENTIGLLVLGAALLIGGKVLLTKIRD